MCGPNRSLSNRRRAVDCSTTEGDARAMYPTTASRQLPWCGSSRMSDAGTPPSRAASLAAGSVSMSPESSTLAPVACSRRTTSEQSLSRRERKPRAGQSTRHETDPVCSTSPAATSTISTPAPRAAASSSATAGIDSTADTKLGCTAIRRTRA